MKKKDLLDLLGFLNVSSRPFYEHLNEKETEEDKDENGEDETENDEAIIEVDMGIDF